MKIIVRKRIANSEEITVEEAVLVPGDFPWDAVYAELDRRFAEQNRRLTAAMVEVDKLPPEIGQRVLLAQRLLCGEPIPEGVEA